MTTWNLRPPWPFEMNRFNALIGPERPQNGWLRPRVWEMPAPNRFVGAAWWSPSQLNPPDASVEIRLMLRPKYRLPAVATEMLRPLFAEIQEAGFSCANLVVAEREIWEKILNQFGLNWASCDELWSVDGAAIRDRMRSATERWSKRLPRNWRTRPIAEADWDFIETSSRAAEFLIGPNLYRVRNNLDSALSSVVETSDGLVGALLATRVGMTVVLEFLGTIAPHSAAASWVTHLTLQRLCQHNPATQFDRVMFTINPARTCAARNLGRRFGGTLVRSRHRFSGCLQGNSSFK